MVTRLFIDFSDAQGQLTSVVGDGILTKFKVIQACMVVRVKKIHPKMKALEWSPHFSHYKSKEIFPDAQGHLTPHPEL